MKILATISAILISVLFIPSTNHAFFPQTHEKITHEIWQELFATLANTNPAYARYFPDILTGIAQADEKANGIMTGKDFKEYVVLDHCYNPVTDGGCFAQYGKNPKISGDLNRFTALRFINNFTTRSLKRMAEKKYSSAFYFLGYNLHVIQDLAIPYHSRAIIGNLHSDYEQYVDTTLDTLQATAVDENFSRALTELSAITDNKILAQRVTYISYFLIDFPQLKTPAESAKVVQLAKTGALTYLKNFIADFPRSVK